MKIHLLSDVHIEMNHVDYSAPIGTELVILAGDIGTSNNGLKWGRKTFPNIPIIYVAGNHEYYEGDIADISLMRSTAKELDIIFLENDEIIIDDIRFLGCTFWTDLHQYNRNIVDHAWDTMNDYKLITCKNWWANLKNKENALTLMNPDSTFGFDPEHLSPTVSYLLHQQSVKWLETKLNKNHNGKTVVITHHSPSFYGTSQLIDEQTSYCYSSSLDEFIQSYAIDYWLHGHIHRPLNHLIGKTRIVSNTRGYPLKYPTPEDNICKGFNKDLIIEL